MISICPSPVITMAGSDFGRLDGHFSNGHFNATSFKAYLAEFISTVLFVFAGVGSPVAYTKLTSDAALDPWGHIAIALCHGFVLFVAVWVTSNISGGHVNPAVTFGLAVGRRITILTGIIYVVAQLAGAIAGAFLVKAATGLDPPTHSLAEGVGAGHRLVLEISITFTLVYMVYTTAAYPKKGSIGTIAPITIGLTVSANILAAGPFSGGSMNPARSFGPAVATGDFRDNWIYWVGPLVGGGLAGLFYTYESRWTEHEPFFSDEEQEVCCH